MGFIAVLNKEIPQCGLTINGLSNGNLNQPLEWFGCKRKKKFNHTLSFSHYACAKLAKCENAYSMSEKKGT